MRRVIQKSRYIFQRKKIQFFLKCGFQNYLLRNRAGKRILIYHGVDREGRIDLNSRFISKQLLEKQLAYFSKHFNCVSIAEAFTTDQIDKGKLTVALSFDDGYLNNFTNALPLLEKYNIPASFYITGLKDTTESILWPDLVDISSLYLKGKLSISGEVFYKNAKGEYESEQSKLSLKQSCKLKGNNFREELIRTLKLKIPAPYFNQLSEYWTIMDNHTIKALAESKLVTVGSHGYYHNNLGEISFDEAKEELVKSKKYLENIIQKEVDELAYPDGSYTREVVDYAKSIGFTKQLAVDYLFTADKQDNCIEKRFGMNPYITFEDQVTSVLKGSYY